MLDSSDPKPDLDRTIEFLLALRPGGPWNLAAIVPDGAVYSRTFTNPKSAHAWLAKHADDANLHFTANPATLPTGKSGRVRKDDISAIEFLHGDYDVDNVNGGAKVGHWAAQK